MSCKCCVSLRGLAYFGASTHIVVGAMFFVEFLEGLFSISQSKLLQTDTINIGTERLVYHWVFLSLGFLIFQGIDRESKTLLKRSSIIFLILQALTFAIRLRYGYMQSSLSKNPFVEAKSDYNSDTYHRGLGLTIVATGAYLMTLFLYVRKLESNIHGGRLFRPHTNAAHIPLSTTNFGWYSQTHPTRNSRGGSSNSNNNNSSNTLYSPLNFFGGVMGATGFNPLVWTNPGPPPPYSDAAPPSEVQLNRSLPTVHTHNMQPCSSRTMMNSVSNNDNADKNASSRTSERNENDPSVVPLLEDDNEDKNGLEC
ncbi:unnamed protein product [Orchesella dallaii]|uniref:Uncharacterized protein n=1 Tax=Orchesella dallaii TaxID=48710 RepID=A0ABP1QZP7_9HEXA